MSVDSFCQNERPLLGYSPRHQHELSGERYSDALLVNQTDRLDVLELFRCYDTIVSSPENYPEGAVHRGQDLTVKLNARDVYIYFKMLEGELEYRQGEIPQAKAIFVEAVGGLLPYALKDPLYNHRLQGAIQNAISSLIMDGDFEEARETLRRVAGVLKPDVLEQLRKLVGPPPTFWSDFDTPSKQASDFLESEQSVLALEWYQEAERQGRAASRRRAASAGEAIFSPGRQYDVGSRAY